MAWLLVNNERSWWDGFVPAAARAVPPLLVVLAALVLVSAGWQRGPAGRLAATGALLMVVPGLAVDGPESLTGLPSHVYRLLGSVDFAEAYSVGQTTGVSTGDAIVHGLYLAGLGLVTTACLTGARTGPAREPAVVWETPR
jgi:hypothetical protein